MVTFQTLANGRQIIDLNDGARFGATSGTSAAPRDYVHIRLEGATQTLFNDTQSVFNWDDQTTVSVAGSYISFVVDRRNERSYDLRGDATAITFDAVPITPPPPVTPDPVSGGVPEPATWAMLILGFGLVGAAARRRRGLAAA